MKRAMKWLPEIDTDRCTGCEACIKACGPGSLALINGVAVLVNPDTCGSEEHCIAPCQYQAIRMAWLPFDGNPRRGRWKIPGGKE